MESCERRRGRGADIVLSRQSCICAGSTCEGGASAFIDRQKGSKVFFVLLVPRKKVRRAIPVRQIDTIAFLG